MALHRHVIFLRCDNYAISYTKFSFHTRERAAKMPDTVQDRNGHPITNGARVRWTGEKLGFTRQAHQAGFTDLHTGDCVVVNCRYSDGFVLVLFDGHTRHISVGPRGLEVIWAIPWAPTGAHTQPRRTFYQLVRH